ncbi:hypothetical protein Fmac_027398 [Flemingia macrophylla]|uniref:Late embryogenesis abundant protein LEA-2 subgroup domain-containing protein n=1 Tax=Flemingia macrophylla TaxID=520843 RepID=A0ABD1LHN1_9FABA
MLPIHIYINSIYLFRLHQTKRTFLNDTPHSFPLDMDEEQPKPNTTDTTPVPRKERLRTRCCYCLCHTFWILLVIVIIIVMLVILVLYIIITPRSFRFHVTEARLAQFDHSNTTLRYNLLLNITATNPNKKLKIYYDVVRATALYHAVSLSTTDVNMPWNSYLQDKKASNRFSAVFSGKRVVPLNRKQVLEFHEDSEDGVFPIVVKIRFNIRFRLGDLQSGHFNARGTCAIKVPLATSKVETMAAFDPTKCRVDF